MMDNFIINCKFKSGKIASVSVFCGVIEPPMPIIRMDYFGKKGSLTMTHTEGKDGWLKVRSKRLELEPLNYIHFAAETESIGGFQHLDTELRMALSLEKCIKENLEPIPGVVDGAKVIAVGDAAWESIKNNGKVVKVKNDF
jgi:predicted dehydrogenase